MRALFLVLLLANAALFYWQSEWRERADAGQALPALPADANVQRLQLLSEQQGTVPPATAARGSSVRPAASAPVAIATPPIEESQQELPALESPSGPDTAPVPATEVIVETIVETMAETIVDTTPDTAQRCYQLGPFVDATAAEQAASRLRALDINVALTRQTERSSRGYWIYLPPLPGLSAASQVAGQLQAKGIKDLFIMGKGEHENAISLGLYRSREAAMERLNEVKKLGYNPAIDEQFREQQTHWLTLRGVPAEGATTDGIIQAAAQFAPATLGEQPCE